MQSTFTSVYVKSGEWYVGYIEEVPGANTQGRTLDEARENLREALELVLQANRELAERELAGKDVVREPITIDL
ncbi:MAG: type II toxin-antitoxin system HicB family antitoxin [Chloroflexi bacterium]|nr:type II toxin-antitoxin system HicB family antitoxin [Chloroflexota bacterium]